MIPFDPLPLREEFPAFVMNHRGNRTVFMDAPGGTQVPVRVIEAIASYYRERNANTGGEFAASKKTDETIGTARRLVADLLGAGDPETIVFGQNMTSLTFHLARSLGEEIQPGDEIVVTELDHDANIAPWKDLEERGAVIRFARLREQDGTLDEGHFESLLNRRTKLAAFTCASNALGSITDAARLTKSAHRAGAMVFLDAVQYVPHVMVDVSKLDCDFLVCSAYKFFGPHQGMLYGKREHLERLRPHKVAPAKNQVPYRWETGTQSHEAMAGTSAAIEYLADIGKNYGIASSAAETGASETRMHLIAAMDAIGRYEQYLSKYFLQRIKELPQIHLYGLTDENTAGMRTPTFAFTIEGISPRSIAAHLAERGIYCWSGNYYALRLMQRLGLEESGGAVRIGMTHLNTIEEIDYLMETLAHI